jgi:hypothetical protein
MHVAGGCPPRPPADQRRRHQGCSLLRLFSSRPRVASTAICSRCQTSVRCPTVVDKPKLGGRGRGWSCTLALQVSLRCLSVLSRWPLAQGAHPGRIQVRGAVDALQITHRRRTPRRRPDIYRHRVRLGMRRHLDLRRSARRLHDESMLTPNLGRLSWRLIAVY